MDNAIEEYEELRARYLRVEELAEEIISKAAGDEKNGIMQRAHAM